MGNSSRVLMQLSILMVFFLALAGCNNVPANFQSVLQNLSNSYPALWRLATAFAYVMGFATGLRALYYLKIYGEMRTMTSSNASIKTPVTLLLVSAALIFSPTAFQMFNYTFFASTQVLSYSSGGEAGLSYGATVAVLGLVQFIGLIAFIRGWLFVARAGEQSGQPGTLGKGVTHIIGGVLAINIVQTKDILWNTFGFG